ncbi:hypothetical protein AVEN_195557-1 [Araneus ventricosus]|uniref:Uncharacterized protein n=1 Tax=Araneus ventricosus TaxID=182803 RepID=A0A4Y2EVR8_ARAVE|nr:hypothetical protein AVEN_195557-1 [Araneus ventricosus]
MPGKMSNRMEAKITKSSRLIHESISLPTATKTFSITTKICHEKVEGEIPSSHNDPNEIDATSDLSIPRLARLLSDHPVPKSPTPHADFPPFPTTKDKMVYEDYKEIVLHAPHWFSSEKCASH